MAYYYFVNYYPVETAKIGFEIVNVQLIDWIEENSNHVQIHYSTELNVKHKLITEAGFRFKLYNDDVIEVYLHKINIGIDQPKSKVDVINYNRLLSVIEDIAAMPIEELTDGNFRYLG